MSKLRFRISMSLDGFVAGPWQSVNHPLGPLTLAGGTTFTFVTDGIEAALEQARRAAGGKDVSLGGGANAARQYVVRGLGPAGTKGYAGVLTGTSNGFTHWAIWDLPATTTELPGRDRQAIARQGLACCRGDPVVGSHATRIGAC